VCFIGPSFERVARSSAIRFFRFNVELSCCVGSNGELKGFMVQRGLPEIRTDEQIAVNPFMGCECGLNHFVGCWRRQVCLGYRSKHATELYQERRVLPVSVWDAILSVFP